MKINLSLMIKTLIYLIFSLISLYSVEYIGQFWADAFCVAIIIVYLLRNKLLPTVIFSLMFIIIAKVFRIFNFPIAIVSVVLISNIIFITIFNVVQHVFAKTSVYQKMFTYFTATVCASTSKFLCLFIVIEKHLMKTLEFDKIINYSFGSIQAWDTIIGCFLGVIIYEIFINNSKNRL